MNTIICMHSKECVLKVWSRNIIIDNCSFSLNCLNYLLIALHFQSAVLCLWSQSRVALTRNEMWQTAWILIHNQQQNKKWVTFGNQLIYLAKCRFDEFIDMIFESWNVYWKISFVISWIPLQTKVSIFFTVAQLLLSRLNKHTIQSTWRTRNCVLSDSRGLFFSYPCCFVISICVFFREKGQHLLTAKQS